MIVQVSIIHSRTYITAPLMIHTILKKLPTKLRKVGYLYEKRTGAGLSVLAPVRYMYCVNLASRRGFVRLSPLWVGAQQFFAQTCARKEQDRRSFFRWKRVS